MFSLKYRDRREFTGIVDMRHYDTQRAIHHGGIAASMGKRAM